MKKNQQAQGVYFPSEEVTLEIMKTIQQALVSYQSSLDSLRRSQHSTEIAMKIYGMNSFLLKEVRGVNHPITVDGKKFLFGNNWVDRVIIVSDETTIDGLIPVITIIVNK